MQRNALRLLRSEIGLTQSEFATALNVGFSAVSRWENKGTRPNKASCMAILDMAKRKHVSSACLESLNTLLLASRADDKADRELMDNVTIKMKLEQRELMTSEQLKATLDNMDLGIIAFRIYNSSPGVLDEFYHNDYCVKLFGYTENEFKKMNAENMHFALYSESIEKFKQSISSLLVGEIGLPDFTLKLRAVRKGGNIIWVEVKAISLAHYSYGCELIVSCRDVTQSVEVERRYVEEVTVRDASILSFMASVHCDLDANKVFRTHNIKVITGGDGPYESADALFGAIANAMHDGADKDSFLRKVSRESLLAAFARKAPIGSERAFCDVAGRWLCSSHVLVKNPYTGHTEAMIYFSNQHGLFLAEKMLDIISEQFFEYIGVIDAKTEMFESYYSNSHFMEVFADKGHYPSVCHERLGALGNPDMVAAEIEAICLERVQANLNEKKFYSTIVHYRDEAGDFRAKKVTFTYLDDIRRTIIVAQSDLGKLSSYIRRYSELLSSEETKQAGDFPHE